MQKNTEFRNYQIRALDNESRTIEGFIPYNSLSEDLGFREQILPGAFSKTLVESKDIKALYSHDDAKILARTKNGSLTFSDGADGLRFRFDAPSTTDGNDVLEMCRSGLIDGCSFGFQTISDSWHLVNGEEVRDLVEVRLFEVSLVGFPAYPQSRVSMRSLSSFFDGKELSEDEQKSVQAEIDKLQSLLPKKNADEKVEPEVQQKEEKKEESKPEVEEDDSKELEALYARLQAAEETIKELEG